MSDLPGVPWVESPLFGRLFAPGVGDAETRRVALELNRFGVAVVELGAGLAAMAAGELARPSGAGAGRVETAWSKSAAAFGLARDPGVLGLLGRLYGRAAFPFESEAVLGRPGPVRSDAVTYGSLPQRYLCTVQVALEDGVALEYHPGSQAWPVLGGADVGHCFAVRLKAAPELYEAAWAALLDGRRAERLVLQRGQAVIRAANLLYGMVGGWSLETRYYFEGCTYYTPCESEPVVGIVSYRHPYDIGTGAIVRNRYLRRAVPDAVETTGSPYREHQGWVNRVPRDFDGARYLAMYPDVAAAGMDPEAHYAEFGVRESRGYLG